MNVYDIGDVVRSKVAFTNLSGTAVDPGTVTFKFKSPLGVITTFVFGTNPEVVRDSTGNYRVDVEPDRQGVWAVKWIGTGVNKGASESAFQVAESQLD